MTLAAPALVPSQLPEDAGDWVLSFTSRLLDQVAAPLFAAPTAGAFLDALPDHLARGAALRQRWLASLSEMPEDDATALLNAWLHPPAPSVLAELERRAAEVLGPERSFLLRRAFAQTFTDAIDGATAVLQRWKSPGDTSVRLVEFGRLAESTAPQDVFGLCWMMVLFGDVSAPSEAVADAASTALLELTSARLDTLAAVLRPEPVRPVRVDDDRLSVEWLRDHRSLVTPLIGLAGLACDDEATVEVVLLGAADPEDVQASIAELRLRVRGDPDAALARLDARALRAGLLGVLSDARGGLIAVTSEAADGE